MDMYKSESSQSYESREWQADSSETHKKPREPSILDDTGGEVPANFAFKECFECAEAREKLKKLVEQEKRLKFETGSCVIYCRVAVVRRS